jgi:hypothetical protein
MLCGFYRRQGQYFTNNGYSVHGEANGLPTIVATRATTLTHRGRSTTTKPLLHFLARHDLARWDGSS